MDNDTINMLWLGGPLGTMERTSIASFLQHGYDVHVYSWHGNLRDGVPSGAVVKDARDVLPEEHCFQYANGSWSACSNLFRWVLLRDRGGWWSDCDVVMLRPFDFNSSQFVCGWEDPPDVDRTRYIGCALVHSPPHHPIVTYCASQAMAWGKNIQWGQAGPKLLTTAVERFGRLNQVLPEVAFQPVHYARAKSLLREPAIVIPEDAYCVHLARNLWGLHGWSTEDYPPDCLYAALVGRFLEGRKP